MTTCARSAVTLALLSALLLAGCGKKTGKTEAKPAQKPDQPVVQEHGHGEHDGHLFDVGAGHKYMGELVFKKEPRKIAIYFIDHETKKPVLATEKEITISGIKHDGKSLKDVVLKAKPLNGEQDGSSYFEATGDAVDAGIDDDHALHGAKFTVTLDGKKIEATIEDHKD